MEYRILGGALVFVLMACTTAPGPVPDEDPEPDETEAGGAGGMRTGGRGGSGGTGSTSPAQDASPSPDAGQSDQAAPDDDGGPAGADAASAADGGAVEAGPAAPACAGGKHLLCEDFESTPAGMLPDGWTRTAMTVQVAEDNAFAGKRALKAWEATFWQKRITRKLTIPGTHWGRIYYKVNTPAPRPASGVVHSTFITLAGTSPLGGSAEWRVVDTVLNSTGRHQFIYNVQPANRREFGKGSSYNWTYDGKWHCAEWFVDTANQAYKFFLDGTEITQIAVNNGPGRYAGSELPTSFTSIAVGWTSYQRLSPGFTGWFDGLAVDGKRIGCE